MNFIAHRFLYKAWRLRRAALFCFEYGVVSGRERYGLFSNAQFLGFAARKDAHNVIAEIEVHVLREIDASVYKHHVFVFSVHEL